jgi:hypothetical protein
MKRKFITKLFFGLLIISSIFLIAARFLQEEPPAPFDTISALLLWIFAGGGAMWFTGRVMAFLLENWTAYHNFPLLVKKLFPVVLAGILGIVAQALYVSDLLTMLPPAVHAAILWAINYFFSQKQYAEIKEGAYGASTREAAAILPPTTDG